MGDSTDGSPVSLVSSVVVVFSLAAVACRMVLSISIRRCIFFASSGKNFSRFLRCHSDSPKSVSMASRRFSLFAALV